MLFFPRGKESSICPFLPSPLPFHGLELEDGGKLPPSDGERERRASSQATGRVVGGGGILIEERRRVLKNEIRGFWSCRRQALPTKITQQRERGLFVYLKMVPKLHTAMEVRLQIGNLLSTFGSYSRPTSLTVRVIRRRLPPSPRGHYMNLSPITTSLSGFSRS